MGRVRSCRCASLGWPSPLAALVAALMLLTAAPSRAQPLPEPASITRVEQADEALAQVAVAREDAAEHRYRSLLACAERIWVNRCRLAVETEHRRARERFAAVERRAREVLREARNLERNQALAGRLAQAREEALLAPEAEDAARAQSLARDARRAAREIEDAERERQAAVNLERHARRQQEREAREKERLEREKERAERARPPG
ncbi:MAG: hypothetical protein KGQ67_06030 [Betaproteobacteria bacterium]|nr:hypothetical protein [Betaproteobacteria bacterium]